jgi:ankyrin repeat protein
MTYIDSPPISNDGNIVLNPRNGYITVDEQAKYQRLLQSLTFQRMDARLLNIANALPQTCRWILKEEKFKMWIARKEIEDNHGFLWIKGKPGSGKSTIMKEAVKMAKRKQSRDIIISYFFNARAPGHLEKSSVGVYRSLVHQILQACPHLQGRFTEMFAAKDREDFDDNWTPTELQGFLTDIVESLEDCPLNVFIDALDEGDENDARQLIAFLEELSLRAVTCGTLLRICLSSRHYPHISIQKGLSLVMEHQDGQRDDIDMYVRLRLIGDEGHEMEELRDEVCQKSSRVFLWVVLVIPILNKSYDRGEVAAMKTRLKEIPDSLDGLFAEILARNAEDIDSSVLLLQWVLFSMRPLSPVELYHAIQSGLTSSPIEGATTLSEETLDRYLINCSRGLTEVTRTKPPLVQFIHETVRDFLIRENGLTKIDPGLAGNIKGISHERLHTACLRYFDQCLSLNQNYQGESVPECDQAADVQRKFPFSEYAVSCMFSHADVAEASGIRHREFLRRFHGNGSNDLLKWIQFRNTFQRYRVRKYTMEVHLLYILAEQNLANLGKVLIDDKVDVDARGERYGNALQAACVGGHEQMTKLLVESGASINVVGGEHEYALCAAVHGKHESIMRLLLRTGILPPVKALEKRLFMTIARGYLSGVEVLIDAGATTSCANNRQETPLYLASKKSKLLVIDLLIRRGANVNAQGGEYGNALQAALAGGHEQVVRLLIEKGADVNAQGGYYGNALQTASARGHEQVARLLVEKGADVNAQRGYYGNALQTASARGHEQVDRLLIEKGADVNAQGGYYGNALQTASARGHEQVARLLVEKGADVNAQRGYYGNALQTASARGHEQVVRLLIEKGADVNAQGGEYGNALQAALAGGHEQVARLLIEKGADVNTQGGYYGNVLQAALAGGHEQVARLLVEKGANFNAQGGYYGNTLQAASARGYEQVARLLIEKGANVNAQGGYYGNALQAALVRDHEQVARLLIEKEANVNTQGGK